MMCGPWLLLLSFVWISTSSATRTPFSVTAINSKGKTTLALSRLPSLLQEVTSVITMNSNLEHRKTVPHAADTLSESASQQHPGGVLDEEDAVVVEQHSRSRAKYYSSENEAVDDDNDDNEQATLLVRGGGAAAPSSESILASSMQRVKIGFYFGLWYALNVFYNSK
jgi:hypothetical protein